MLSGAMNILTFGCKDFGFDGRFLMWTATRQSKAKNRRDYQNHIKLHPPKLAKQPITYGKKLVFDDKTGELVQVNR